MHNSDMSLLLCRLSVVLLALLSACAVRAPAQTRPAGATPSTRFAVQEDSAFTRAVRRGTRTRNGRPGPRAWQQHAHYDIEARLHPETNRLVGEQRVRYHNRSPDTLHRVAVHLRQNHVQSDPSGTGGVSLHRVAVNDTSLSPGGRPGYRVDDTVAWLDLPTPLAPQDNLTLSVSWSYVVPRAPADGRQGRDRSVFFLGYWYPQLAVYDDLDGWVAEPYTGQAEFYMGPADYDVRLTVPAGWLVGATGRLHRPADVLSARSRRRLARARRTGAVVEMQGPNERDEAPALRTPDSTTTWHFRAESVRDFAWGTSARYVWDATRALVPSSSAAPAPKSDTGASPPDTVMIHSFYRPTAAAAAWPQAARYTRDAVETLSSPLRPYPYPTMTAMEGVLRGGGMEYPMLTIMRPWADSLKLAGDLTHEVAHTWLPMEVGTNEKRYVWMDEGFAQYYTARAMRRRYGPGPRPQGRPNDSEVGQRRRYLNAARRGYEVPLMTHGDDMPRALYFVLPYDKAAQVLSTLRELLGEALFDQAYRTFIDRWWGKHPSPYDFFNTIAEVSGRDLSWFWHTWFYTTAALDQAVHSVETNRDSTTIAVTSPGRAPMPVRLALTRTDGTTTRRTLPVDPWLRDADTVRVSVPASPPLRRVEIDPEEAFPDVDRSNQVWRRP